MKKAAYERFGIGTYWIAGPDADDPGLMAFELSGGRYELAARVSGGEVFAARRPFPVDVRPSALVARLRRPEPPRHQAS